MSTFRLIPSLLIAFFLVVILSGCEEGTKEPTENNLIDTLERSDEETTRGLEVSAMRPELIGTWKLVDMRMGNEPLAQAIPGNSYVEFLGNGTVALMSDEFEPDTAAVSQNGDMLGSTVWLSDQRIDSLTTSRLILVEELDGAEISYIYERQ